MADVQITIQEVDDTRYDLLVTYYDKKYMKSIDTAYLETCIQILKLYPNILKDALMKNQDKLDFFTFTEGKQKNIPISSTVYNYDEELQMTVTESQKNMTDVGVGYQYDGELKMTFTIDLQFGKEVIEICSEINEMIPLEEINDPLYQEFTTLIKEGHKLPEKEQKKLIKKFHAKIKKRS